MSELEYIFCQIMQLLDEQHLLNKLPKFYIADLNSRLVNATLKKYIQRRYSYSLPL